MGDDAIEILADSLKENQTLQHLLLEKNNFGGGIGTKRLGHMLKTNTTLKLLSLKGILFYLFFKK